MNDEELKDIKKQIFMLSQAVTDHFTHILSLYFLLHGLLKQLENTNILSSPGLLELVEKAQEKNDVQFAEFWEQITLLRNKNKRKKIKSHGANNEPRNLSKI